MTNKTILKKAIKKAVENGWQGVKKGEEYFIVYELEYIPYEIFIFSHDFAKAIWGEERTCLMCGSIEFEGGMTPSTPAGLSENWERCTKCGAETLDRIEFDEGNTLPAYLYHLQQMVLEEEPLKYLEKFLDISGRNPKTIDYIRKNFGRAIKKLGDE